MVIILEINSKFPSGNSDIKHLICIALVLGKGGFTLNLAYFWQYQLT